MNTDFQFFLEEAGLDTSAYSGRGMFGKNCLSVRIHNVNELFLSVIENIRPDTDTYMISRAFRNMRTDSLGLGMVAYFPEIEYSESLNLSDED